MYSCGTWERITPMYMQVNIIGRLQSQISNHDSNVKGLAITHRLLRTAPFSATRLLALIQL